MSINFENKLVGIINKEIEVGVALNSLAHASIVLGAQVGERGLLIKDYKDQASNVYPISSMPFIILRAKSSEIRKSVNQAKELNLKHVAFLESMTVGTFVEQMERTANIHPDNLNYFCAVMYGKWDIVSEITRKLSLYK